LATRFIHSTTPAQTLKSDRFKRNSAIPFETVYVKNEQTGELKEDKLSRILAEIDFKTHTVVLINPIKAIVRIQTRDELRDAKKREKAHMKEQKSKNTHKQLLLSFNMAENDRQRQIERARKEFQKGARVDLLIAPKPGKVKMPPYQEIKRLAQALVEELSDMAEEYKTREIKNRSAAVFLKPLHSASKPEGEAEDGSQGDSAAAA
jgi:translation initiation factor IF-3